MKALTLTQPWSTLVALGQKRLETRSWQTSYRGPLAIHAAKGFPGWAKSLTLQPLFEQALLINDENAHLFCNPVGKYCAPEWLPNGCVVAACNLVHIYRTENVFSQPALTGEHYCQGGRLYVSPEEWAFGDYSPGRFVWVLDNIQALPEPIPAKGALGLWEWTP